jgi:hypothetical protein
LSPLFTSDLDPPMYPSNLAVGSDYTVLDVVGLAGVRSIVNEHSYKVPVVWVENLR